MADLEKDAALEDVKAENKNVVIAIRSSSNCSSNNPDAGPPVGAMITADNVTIGEGDVVAYKTMHWVQTGVVMIAETISLGILSLPKVLATVGFVPGILLILCFGIVTTYTGYAIWQLKIAFPELHTFADALAKVMGNPGRIIGEIMQALLLVFIMAAHVVTFSVMMNTLTNHGLCTIVFTVIGAVVSFLVTIPRTLKANSYVSIFSCVSICAATLIAMVGIGISRPDTTTFAVVPSNLTSIARGAMSVSNVILAYTGHIAYFAIISEMKEPRDFPRALAMLQTTTMTFYLAVAAVIYSYAGHTVKSPALGSASPIVGKVAWGIAAPTIIVAGVITALIAGKSIYSHVWHKTPNVVSEKTLKARGSWLTIIAGLWVIAWLIANAIPVFEQLLGLIGAAFGSWISLGFPAYFWLWMDHRAFKEPAAAEEDVVKWRRTRKTGWKRRVLFGANVVIVAIGAAICGLGLYGAAVAIKNNNSDRAPFSCADNSK